MKCSLAKTGAVKVGVAACPLRVCTIHRLQSPFTESGPLMFLPWAGGNGAFTPQVGSSGLLSPGVPYQTILTRTSSPAAIQAKTLLCKVPAGEADVSIVIGGVAQVLPWSVE